MTATPIWTVHCSGCGRWDEQYDTKAEAERIAKRGGWRVDTRRDGAHNFCPKCRKKLQCIATTDRHTRCTGEVVYLDGEFCRRHLP